MSLLHKHFPRLVSALTFASSQFYGSQNNQITSQAANFPYLTTDQIARPSPVGWLLVFCCFEAVCFTVQMYTYGLVMFGSFPMLLCSNPVLDHSRNVETILQKLPKSDFRQINHIYIYTHFQHISLKKTHTHPMSVSSRQVMARSKARSASQLPSDQRPGGSARLVDPTHFVGVGALAMEKWKRGSWGLSMA